MNPFLPMRPGRSVPTRALLPKGWLIQPKWHDERAILVGGVLYNRHQEPFAPQKAKQFQLPHEDQPLDLLLVGFRTGTPRRVIILDRPFARGGYRERNPDADVWLDPEECWARYRDGAEVEGLVARHPEAPYCFGNSGNLVKWKE